MLNLKLSRAGVFLLLFLVALIVYSGSIKGEFLFDDQILIPDNMYIQDLKYVPLLFMTDVFLPSVSSLEKTYNYYRPVQTVSFAIDYRLWGKDPFGYHLTNIFIHSITAFLMFCLVLKLFSSFPLALLSSLLFTVHPLQTESVSFICGRSETLVTLFTIMTLLAYVKYAESYKTSALIVSMLSFVLAILSKEAGFFVFVPFAIVFCGMRAKMPRDSLLLHFIIFAGLLVVYMMLRMSILVPLKMLPYDSPSFILSTVNFSRAVAEYLKLLFFPHNLHILRTIPEVTSFRPQHLILPLAMAVSGIIVLIMSVRHKNYVFLFGGAWFIFSLLHLMRTMYKFNVDIAIEEHWVYLASVGFFVCLAYIILRLNKGLRVIAGAGLIAIYGWLAFMNTLHWNTQLGFYRYNLQFVRKEISLIPQFNYTTILSDRGMTEEALLQIDSMLKSYPDRPNIYMLQGDIFKKIGKFDAAEKAYLKAMDLDQFCWQANLRLKSLSRRTGRPYKEKIGPGLSPEEAAIVSQILNGQFYAAITAVEEKLAVSPAPMLYTLKGLIFSKTGHYRAALDAYNAALKLDPRNKTAMHNLAVLYYNMNQLAKAVATMEKAEQLAQPPR